MALSQIKIPQRCRKIYTAVFVAKKAGIAPGLVSFKCCVSLLILLHPELRISGFSSRGCRPQVSEDPFFPGIAHPWLRQQCRGTRRRLGVIELRRHRRVRTIFVVGANMARFVGHVFLHPAGRHHTPFCACFNKLAKIFFVTVKRARHRVSLSNPIRNSNPDR
jgi:hypothetical protein